MTKINWIALHGFKSFAHKTEIPLDGKFNVILGPNGAGKSNLSDALCFVLGRLSAKSMRAEKASNLIFNGAKKRQPASSAVVEIAFCNKSRIFPVEGEEVVISRSIKKDGSSTYRINGKRRTRTEVLDTLGAAKINPEGYNIIMQGDINRFVDMPSIERRQIIEEISDVTAYEEKKHKAILELNKVEEKLNNAQIILTERNTYLEELRKDRNQALRFKKLKDLIDSNKATVLHFQIREKEKEKAAHDSETKKHQEKIDIAEKEIKALKDQAAEHRKQSDKINQQIEQKGEKSQVKLHHLIEDLKVSLTRDRARTSTLKDELNRIRQRRDQMEQEKKDLEERVTSSSRKTEELRRKRQQKEKELENAENSLAQFKKKHHLEDSQEIEQELEKKDKLIDQKEDQVQKLRQEQQESLRAKDRLEMQLGNLDERLKKIREIEKEHQQQLSEVQQKKNDFKFATLKLNQSLDADSSFASQLSNARKRLGELQEKEAQLKARSASFQADLAGSLAITSIKKQKFKGVHGTVAELGQVNRPYARALETAAGARMQHLIVDDDQVAADCIKFLKEKKLGTASFIPLNKIKSKPISAEDRALLKEKGVKDFALDAISFKPAFRKAFEYVFGNTLVVEDIDVARKVGIGRIKMATLDGNLAELSGVMRGGHITSRSLGFKEKDSLEEMEKMEKEIGQQESVIAALQTKREANEKEIEVLRKQRAELEGEVIKLEKSLHLEDADLTATATTRKELGRALDKINEGLQKVQENISAVNRELAELKTSKQKLRSQMKELRDPRLLAQLTAFEESRQGCREEIIRLEQELKNSSSQAAELFSPEEEKIKEILKQQDRDEEKFRKEMKELVDKVSQGEKELAGKEEESKQFYAQYRESFAQREKLNSEISRAESEMENIRERRREHEREINLVSLKGAELKARLAALQEEFSRYQNVVLFENKDPEELRKEINRFEVLLAKMSAVNMKALEVYEQVEGEFNKLMEKKADLEKEKVDVLTLMNEIETKKKDHFMKTFNLADENFQRIFSSLFKKGKAYLQLDNPASPFEDGLSIKVKLTGRRFMDIKSLSGGEKSLTALSFIFAIQEYQPSTFYILDEVDAALDKHNSETLSKLIRNYADRAQYVLISHNDALISQADTLYGVSMNEGISKVTSLKI